MLNGNVTHMPRTRRILGACSACVDALITCRVCSRTDWSKIRKNLWAFDAYYSETFVMPEL